MKYLIASGWWSCDPADDGRDKLFGDDAIRDREFHRLWRKAIDRFANPDEIMVVDSASPRKPSDISGENWLEMRRNFGHSTSHDGPFSGYTRAIFISMMYAYANDFDYWVYIEQDALIYGNGIIEDCIEKSRKRIIYGSGVGTPQEIQQSFMIFDVREIPGFIKRYTEIKTKDKDISPEWKFLFAQNYIARLLPTFILKWISQPSSHWRIARIKNGLKKIIRLFDQFDTLKCGYGRVRPINFSDHFFYFQHGNKDEIERFARKLREN